MNQDMKNDEERKLREFLRSSLPRVDAEPRRDLWPAMLRRMDVREPPAVPWFDWALLGLAGACLAFVPRIIPMLLYHL
jgi:hypothetical protein